MYPLYILYNKNIILLKGNFLKKKKLKHMEGENRKKQNENSNSLKKKSFTILKKKAEYSRSKTNVQKILLKNC